MDLNTLYIKPYYDMEQLKLVKKPVDSTDKLKTIQDISGYGLPIEMNDDGIISVPKFQIPTEYGWFPANPTQLLNLKINIVPSITLLNGSPLFVTDKDIGSLEFEAKVFSMIPLMYMARGVGLAAPQVSWDKQVFVMDENFEITEKKITPRIIYNPTYSIKAGKLQSKESCLSVPGATVYLQRYSAVTLSYVNQNGEESTTEFNNFGANIVQHEFDHLYGDTLYRHLSKLDKEKFKSAAKKLKRSDRRREYGVSINTQSV